MANSHLKEWASNQPGQKPKMTVYAVGYYIEIPLTSGQLRSQSCEVTNHVVVQRSHLQSHNPI